MERSEDQAARRDAATEQLFTGVIGALETLHVYVGEQLGLYAVLATVDDATSQELAERAGVAERYAREWLEQQAVAGLLDVVTEEEASRRRRYRLPAGVAEVVADPDSLSYLAPAASLVAGICQALPAVLAAFRTGAGVPYEEYGPQARNGIAGMNRPMFLHQLAADWIAAMPDVEARLRDAERPARVADLGCGTGASSIALARAYPALLVDGVDLDAASIDEARRQAQSAGVADRVSFHRASADEAGLTGPYDLITLFETLHDMADPVGVLRSATAALAPDGVVLVGDEKVAEVFTAPGNDIERFNYGWSALHCLPASLTEPGSAAIGTVIRPSVVADLARRAGLTSTSVLPIENDVWRFYRLDR